MSEKFDGIVGEYDFKEKKINFTETFGNAVELGNFNNFTMGMWGNTVINSTSLSNDIIFKGDQIIFNGKMPQMDALDVRMIKLEDWMEENRKQRHWWYRFTAWVANL